jgi:hypothetical protein
MAGIIVPGQDITSSWDKMSTSKKLDVLKEGIGAVLRRQDALMDCIKIYEDKIDDLIEVLSEKEEGNGKELDSSSNEEQGGTSSCVGCASGTDDTEVKDTGSISEGRTSREDGELSKDS